MARFRERRFAPVQYLRPERRQHIEQLLRRRLWSDDAIVFAYVFGSFARGEPGRDLDVALYTEADRDTSFVLDLIPELEQLIGLVTDVVVMHQASLPLQFAIFRDGKLLFSRDEELRTRLIEQVSRRYWDYAHFRNLFLGVAGAESGPHHQSPG